MTDIAKQLKEAVGNTSANPSETIVETNLSVAEQIAAETLKKLKEEVTECISIGLKEYIESGTIVADVLNGGKWKPDFSNGKQIAAKPMLSANRILPILPN